MDKLRPSDLRPSVKLARKANEKAVEEGKNRLDGKPRIDRIREITASREIDNRLFLLSPDPRLRDKLHTFKNVMEGIMDKYPEIAGMTLLGSYVQGYPNQDSDIDAYVFVDEDTLRPLRPDTSGGARDEAVERGRLKRYLEIRKNIYARTPFAGLSNEEQGVKVCGISKKDVVECCLNGTLSTGVVEIFHLFHAGVGAGIYEYRELVISTLEGMKEEGEKLWLELIYRLFDCENLRFRKPLRGKRMRLYPRTLEKARKHFLGHMPNPHAMLNAQSSIS